VNEFLLEHEVIGGYNLGQWRRELERYMLLCVTEQNTRAEIDRLADLLGKLAK